MPTQDLAQVYRTWLDAVNARNADVIPNLLATRVTYNGQELNKQGYITQLTDSLQAASVDNIELDTLITGADSVAARLIYKATLQQPYHGAQVTGKPSEWTEHVLVWFDSGKITRFQSILDVDTLRSGTSQVPRTPSFDPPSPPPPGFDMAAMYMDYIRAINDKTLPRDLDKFVQPRVSHNDRHWPIDEYRHLIESSQDVIQALYFDVTELIVDEATQQIASRIEFTGKPVAEFAGIPPTGRESKFSEHAFYRLDGGKIKWVWSVLDLESYRKSLQEGS